MDLNGIRSELRRLTELTAEWQARGGANDLEREVALGMLCRLYEAIRFQERAREADRPAESAVEVPLTLDLDGILDPSATLYEVGDSAERAPEQAAPTVSARDAVETAADAPSVSEPASASPAADAPVGSVTEASVAAVSDEAAVGAESPGADVGGVQGATGSSTDDDGIAAKTADAPVVSEPDAVEITDAATAVEAAPFVPESDAVETAVAAAPDEEKPSVSEPASASPAAEEPAADAPAGSVAEASVAAEPAAMRAAVSDEAAVGAESPGADVGGVQGATGSSADDGVAAEAAAAPVVSEPDAVEITDAAPAVEAVPFVPESDAVETAVAAAPDEEKPSVSEPASASPAAEEPAADATDANVPASDATAGNVAVAADAAEPDAKPAADPAEAADDAEPSRPAAPEKGAVIEPALFGLDEIVQHKRKQRVIMSLYDDGPVRRKGAASERSARSETTAPKVADDAVMLPEISLDEPAVQSDQTAPSLADARCDECAAAVGSAADDALRPEAGDAESALESAAGAKSESPRGANDAGDAADSVPAGAVLGEVINRDVQTLAETLAAPRSAVADIARQASVEDLRAAIGINDKFLLIRDLFDGDAEACDRAIDTLNGFDDLDECMIHIAEHYAWNPNSDGAKLLMELLERKLA